MSSPTLLSFKAWTHITTSLLEQGGCRAWDILDNAMELEDIPSGQHQQQPKNHCSFVEALNKELTDAGLIFQLAPARTASEAKTDELISILQGIGAMKPMASSDTQGATTVEDTSNNEKKSLSSIGTTRGRGDRSAFVKRSDRTKPEFARNHPFLSSLIHKVEQNALYHLASSMDFDLSLTSVQIAEYPGDGIAGYPRHCDRSNGACKEEGEMPDELGQEQLEAKRILTFVYYLTPENWKLNTDRGCLRLFSSSSQDSSTKQGAVDVAPYSNRLLVFRSDGVEHQVLPSLRRTRRAITVWMYGKLRGRNDPADSSHLTNSPPKAIPIHARRNLLPDHQGNGSFLDPIHSIKKTAESNKNIIAPPQLLISSESSGKDEEECHLSTIFVSIAAFRDSETGPTLRHLMATAQNPDRIFVGLVLQVDTRNESSYDKDQVLGNLPTSETWYGNRVRCLTLDAQHATGPCSARAMAQELHRGEDYVLQIDSHMRFRQNWDSYLIQHLHQCPITANRKAMLTTYPVGYQLPNNIPNETRGTLLVPWKFDPKDGFLRQRAQFFTANNITGKTSSPVLCHLYAAGFNFARAAVLRDCPYDGSLHHLFFGEETSMAVRLYTAGYDLYAPAETVCYHLWSRSHRPTFFSQKDEGTTQNSGSFSFLPSKEKMRNASMKVVKQQMLGRGRGLGSERTVGELEARLGVDFSSQTVDLTKTNYSGVAFADEVAMFKPGDTSLQAKVQGLDSTPKLLISRFLSQS